MNYTAFNPSEELAAFVKCYWTLDDAESSQPVKQRILPDGCMEMIFHYGDPYKQYIENGEFIVQPKCFVFGQITVPLEIEPTAKTGMFAVRFYPGTFTPFTKIQVSSMTNRAVPLEELFGTDGADLEKRILHATDTGERIKITEIFLLKILAGGQFMNRMVQSSVALILELNGRLPIARVLNQNEAKPIGFVLNKNVKNKLCFENTGHDFPKKIQYTKISNTILFVEVLGEGDKGFSYKMIKQIE